MASTLKMIKGAFTPSLLPALLATLLSAGCAAVPTARDGDLLADQGNWDEAVYSYSKAYELQPSNIDLRHKYWRARIEAAKLHFEKGQLLMEEGSYSAALLEFQAVLTLDHSHNLANAAIAETKKLERSRYYYKKGQELVSAERFKDAKRAFKKAVEIAPSNTKAAEALNELRGESGGYYKRLRYGP